MSRAESIWLLSLASMRTAPPRRPRAWISIGRKPSSAEAADVGAEGAQGLDQAAHRALSHLRHAVDPVDAARRRGAQRGQEARDGAGVADEKIRRWRRDLSPLPGDPDG